LSAEAPGVVASAATLIQAHAEVVTSNPTREPDRAVATALKTALARPWGDDLVETRGALLDAAAALGLEEGRAAARTACKDSNATVRMRAVRALVAYGEAAATCPAPDAPGEPAPELAHAASDARDRRVRVLLDTDAGPLALRFDPAFAPVAVARFVALARAGFYTGVAVHRVVPGFVVQFGDRGGDGYGGSGDLLRCETAPVPFAPFDVGVALAGRDTGSSQLFVTLARTPHLDGEYAWVGRADGDWAGVTEGDVVQAVRVEE
ncbi:MAG TPA: peptidylprolyl isomerase, partial [Polyangiaceae bacterium]|nr:peptidylprolyl isomerase [Polyangiaceae bacterium]